MHIDLKKQILNSKDHVELICKQNLQKKLQNHLKSFDSNKSMEKEELLQKHSRMLKNLKLPAQYIQKYKIMQHYRERYGVILTPKEQKKYFNALDDKGLEIILKKKLAKKKQVMAAQIIQTWVRGHLCRKWYSNILKLRELMAIKIQRLWRRYYRRVVLPRYLRAKQIQVIGMIQKY